MDSSGNSHNGFIENCISLAPDSTYNPNLVSRQNQPLPLPQGISLTQGQRVNFTVAVQFSDGTTSQVSKSLVVRA
jgi:hypothetical protein